MRYKNEQAPEDSLASKEVVIVTEVEHKDGSIERPWDEHLRKLVRVKEDGTTYCPFDLAKSFWNSPQGKNAVKRAIQEGKAFPAD